MKQATTWLLQLERGVLGSQQEIPLGRAQELLLIKTQVYLHTRQALTSLDTTKTRARHRL